VAARAELARRWFDVHDFASELLGQLAYQLMHQERRPVESRERWQAGTHRFRDVLRTLRQLAEAGEPIAPEMRTAWADRGLIVADNDPTAATAQLEQRADREAGLDDVLLGDVDRSNLRTALLAIAPSGAHADVLSALDPICEGQSLPAIAHRLIHHITEDAIS
jgi:hypothetical protein